MRIYHIGLPKTGTTSLQNHFQNHHLYIGTSRPKTPEGQAYRSLTKYLLGQTSCGPDQLDLPKNFLYSEEMILAPRVKGHTRATLERLIHVLQPEDRVVISTRHPKDVLFSRYCERYRQLWSYTFKNAVIYHPLFEPYDYTLYREVLPEKLYPQFEFIDFKDLLTGKCKSIQSLMSTYQIQSHVNKRKTEVSNGVKKFEVQFNKRNFHTLSKAVNNLCCLMFRETKDPLRRYEFFRTAKPLSSTLIAKPSYHQKIADSQKPGLEWLNTNYNVNYLDPEDSLS